MSFLWKIIFIKLTFGLLLWVMPNFVIAQHYRVNSIELHDDEKVKTQKDIIFRELSFAVGDTIMVTNWDSFIVWNEKRIFNLQLFNAVAIQPLFDSNSVSFTIKVQERFPLWLDPKFTLGDRNFNVWARTYNYDLNRVNLGFKLTHLNVGGKRIQTSATFQTGYTKRYGLELNIPFIDKAKKQGIGASIYYTSNKEVAVNTKDNKLYFHTNFGAAQYKEFSLDFHYIYRPQYAWQFKLGAKYVSHHVDHSVLQLNPSFLGRNRSALYLGQFSLRSEYNGVDNWNYPLHGNRFIGVGKFSHSLQDGYHNAALHLQYDYYKKLSKRWYLATDFKMKWTYQNQYAYLFNRNLGYDNDYIRGYEYYVIDGHFMAFGRIDFKYKLLHQQYDVPIKYLETIPIRLYPKIFCDIGYSANRWNPTTLNHKALYSVGLGLDIVTLYDIKVRLEFAYNHMQQYDVYLHRQGN